MEEKLKQFSELDFELRHFGGSLLVASRNVFFFCSRLSIELENYFSGSLVFKKNFYLVLRFIRIYYLIFQKKF